nr:MAG TPA: PURINE NUCLEOTIDE SYNTHESIS REPRESSOR/DNA Complex REGULATION, DNA-BINDING, REPRESSOR, PURINE [Caudoviricetes sp.]
MSWKEEAKTLYFDEHLRIGEIAEQVGKSRQSVSAFLHSLPEWGAEKEHRRVESAKRRKKQKTNWERDNRVAGMDALYESVKREHRQAVVELSRERYH